MYFFGTSRANENLYYIKCADTIVTFRKSLKKFEGTIEKNGEEKKVAPELNLSWHSKIL